MKTAPRQMLRAKGGAARGRPSAQNGRDVAGDLMRAAEQALRDRAVEDITLREIAQGAGATEAMIQYYFGNKAGLLVAISDDLMRSTKVFRSHDIVAKCLAAGSIRPFVGAAATFYAQRPDVIRMMVVEIIRGTSGVSENFSKKYLIQTPATIYRILRLLMAAKIYRADLDIGLAITAVMALAVFPVTFGQSLFKISPRFDKISTEAWADFVAATLDGRFSVSSEEAF